MEYSGSVDDDQKQIRRALAKLWEAQEILSGLIVSHEISIEDLLQERAQALGGRLTRAELEVISKFVAGRSAKAIAEERGLSERTVNNQLRTGCHKLGFGDRREMKGWAVAARQFLLTKPPETE